VIICTRGLELSVRVIQEKESGQRRASFYHVGPLRKVDDSRRQWDTRRIDEV